MDPMLAIYLEELSELVEAFASSTQRLIDSPQDHDTIADAERQLHTIKGGARMTGLSVIGDLSHAGESLLNLVASGKITTDSHLLEKLQELSNELFRLYELVAKGKEIESVEGLIDELLRLSGDSKVDIEKTKEKSLEASTFSKHDNKAVETIKQTQELDEVKALTDTADETVPEESTVISIDPMVAIFLEELSELVEAFDSSTQKLMDNPQDTDTLSEAERQLHTIKGGARMTGIMAIGDLSHAGESLLNLVASGKVSADNHLLEKLQRVSDELFRMYELAAKGKDVKPAESLIVELHRLSDDSEAKVEVEVEVEKTKNNKDKDTNTDTEEPNLSTSSTKPLEIIEQAQEPDKVEELVERGSDSLSEDSTVISTEAEAIEPIDPMVAIFLEELSELVEAFDANIQKLLDDPQDGDTISEAERQLHTIKGGARMTGLMAIGDLSHAGESLLNLVSSNKVAVDKSLLEKLQQVSDVFYKMYEAASIGQPVQAEVDLVDELNHLSGQETNSKPDKEDKPASIPLSDTKIEPVIEEPKKPELTQVLADFKAANKETSELEQTLAGLAEELNTENLMSMVIPSHAEKDKEQAQHKTSIRVPIGLINQLITSTNEWGHQNIRLTTQYEKSEKVILELKRTANRLKEQIRSLELEADSLIHAGGPISSLPQIKGGFDPLEMDEYTELQQSSRSLAESLEDLMNLIESLEKGLKSAEKISGGQEQACKKVQEDLISTRMTKVNSLFTRLKRIVRQVSSELGKEVHLVIADENCEMDRTILERITASLEHLIRNSLAHGVEMPLERERVGKSRQGKITLQIVREGPEIAITLEDDGAGIDIEKLKALSIKKGLIDADASLTDKEVYQLILMSGVSTADKISQVSGRGVGMDVVNSEVNTLGGNIIIDSQQGAFTRFTLSVPYNLATNQVMLLDVSGEVLAVPVAKLEGMQRLSIDEVNQSLSQKNPTVDCAGKTYILRYLAKTLGIDQRRKIRETHRNLPAILLEENGQRVAYIVDEIRGNREVMLKPLGVLFEESQLLSSASILGGGEIVLLLNAHELISLGMSGKTMGSRKTEKIKRKEKKMVMVVDDSITVRKVTENLLLSLGYRVTTANDGVNALEVLEDEMPDIILLDIEMPRMDGFELLETIRGNKRWSTVPVIMISSRSGAKHKQHAKALGANGFIGKPWDAKQLASNIKACMNDAKTMTGTEVTV